MTKELAITYVKRYVGDDFIPTSIMTLPDKFIVGVSEDRNTPAYDGLYAVDRSSGKVSGYSQFASEEAMEEFRRAIQTREEV